MPHGCGRAVMRPALGRLRSFSSLTHYTGQWVVVILLYIASLYGGNGQWNFFCHLPQCGGGGGRQWHSFRSFRRRPGAVGSGTLVGHRLTALGQWVVELFLYNVSLL